MIPGNVLRLENIAQSLCKILYSVEVVDDVINYCTYNCFMFLLRFIFEYKSTFPL